MEFGNAVRTAREVVFHGLSSTIRVSRGESADDLAVLLDSGRRSCPVMP